MSLWNISVATMMTMGLVLAEQLFLWTNWAQREVGESTADLGHDSSPPSGIPNTTGTLPASAI
jgi:hypothetical protein